MIRNKKTGVVYPGDYDKLSFSMKRRFEPVAVKTKKKNKSKTVANAVSDDKEQ